MLYGFVLETEQVVTSSLELHSLIKFPIPSGESMQGRRKCFGGSETAPR